MRKFVVGLTTCTNSKQAHTLAITLVQKRLVACVNIVPSVTSIYSWKNKLEKSREVLLLIKTTRAQQNRIKAYFQKSHPYECPECVFFDIQDGLPAYLHWISAQVD